MRTAASLTAPSQLQSLLTAQGIRVKKHLGQNFLVDGNVLRKIVRLAELGGDEFIIEVGAGVGTLTRSLAPVARHVLAVELDQALLPLLREHAGNCPNVTVHHGDVLQLDLSDIARRMAAGKITVIGNLPYQITSPVLELLMEHRSVISSALLMVQKEVAERICAPPGSRASSSLTVFAQAYAQPRIAARVSRNAFYPRPRVDSAIIALRFRPRPIFQAPEGVFRAVVRAAYQWRRKTLKQALALSSSLAAGRAQIEAALQRAGLDGSRRGETLAIEEFDRLSQALASET